MAFSPKLLQQGAGGAGAAEKYIENLFSTYLYTGTGTGYAGSEQNIINGINVSGKGALIWIKARESTAAYNSYWNRHQLYDTNRGITFGLNSNTTGGHGDTTDSMSTRADGFRLASGGSYYQQNFSGVKYVSWTFRQEPKFFDIVTYTGNGNGAGQVINHNLGSTPGFIICKCTSTTQDWAVCARTGGSASPESDITYATGLSLNTTNAASYSGSLGSFPTSTTFNTSGIFTAGASGTYPNLNGQTYVAYLFAHNAGGFGLTGNDNVVSCGSFTTDGSGKFTVNLGYEPQWIMIKLTNFESNWSIFDNMRGMPVGSTTTRVLPNTDDIESSAFSFVDIKATGFEAGTGSGNPYGTGQTWVYLAIRRPMKVPTDATKVFSTNAYSGGSAGRSFNLGFVPDTLLTMRRNTSNYNIINTRLLGQDYLFTNTTDALLSGLAGVPLWSAPTGNISFTTATSVTGWNGSGSDYVGEAFARAPSFFDVVAYTGSVAGGVLNHNLGVAPELMIFKSRASTSDNNWSVQCAFGPSGKVYNLNGTGNYNGTLATSLSASSITLSDNTTNNTVAYVAYLFATCPGVSKVGSYAGSASAVQVDCGFTNGARFVLIKVANAAGGWIVWDSARGIISGNDPYLELNNSNAEITSEDYIDPYSAGFEIAAAAPAVLNGINRTFIFLAIA